MIFQDHEELLEQRHGREEEDRVHDEHGPRTDHSRVEK